jgi:hypothetical protein
MKDLTLPDVDCSSVQIISFGMILIDDASRRQASITKAAPRAFSPASNVAQRDARDRMRALRAAASSCALAA